ALTGATLGGALAGALTPAGALDPALRGARAGAATGARALALDRRADLGRAGSPARHRHRAALAGRRSRAGVARRVDLAAGVAVGRRADRRRAPRRSDVDRERAA